jgi:hypothetical protein
MTRLLQRKTKCQFETCNIWQGRAVVVEALPHYLRVRLKGQRTTFDVSYAGIYCLGAKIAANIRLEEKRQRRVRA